MPRGPPPREPEGMTAARRLPNLTAALGAHPQPHTGFPAPASIGRSRASLKVVRPAGRSTLTLAPLRHAHNPAGNPNKNGHTRRLTGPAPSGMTGSSPGKTRHLSGRTGRSPMTG